MKTYCNPLPLPDYPIGIYAKRGLPDGWLNNGTPCSFRETADPSVIFEDGKWYLYASCGKMWFSDDLVKWTVVDLPELDYAPCAVRHRGKYYLTASNSPLFVSDTPTGPWEKLGVMRDMDGKPYPGGMWDPMMFSDTDGRLYLYWGCGGPGIFAVELDPENPLKAITPVKLLFSFDPEHEWERTGDFNEDPSHSFVEGSNMFKRNGLYYLTYGAPGTQYITYATGCYVGKSPLGPFRYQKTNPVQIGKKGLVRGCGHSCVIDGPNGSILNFYTALACRNHYFERRIGCDIGWIDGNGELHFQDASEIPQIVPGENPHPENGNDAGLLPVSNSKFTSASSQLPARGTSCAADGYIRTWWEAAPEDETPWFEIDLGALFDVSAVRIIWAEPNMDHKTLPPGPWQYVLEGRTAKSDPWEILIDASENQTDLLIDYRTFEPKRIKFARLRVLSGPEGIGVGLTDLTLFGCGIPIPVKTNPV